MRSAPGEPDLLYIDLHLVHEVTSPQAFDGLRLSGRRVRRPELTVATEDHNVPTADIDQPIADPISARQVEVLRAEHRRVRHHQLPDGRPRAGHRPRHRSRAGPHAAGHDDRLRRQPHGHARRVRGAGVRHRHERGRARAGHPDAAPEPPEVDGRRRRRRAAGRRHRQGRHPRHHRRDRHRRRHRPRHRVPRLDDPRPLDGGPDDGLQHVDRGRRQGRSGRARRHDVRLPRGPRPRPDRATAWEQALADWRTLRSDDDAVWDREVHIDATTLRPQVTWGTNPGPGHVDRRRRAVARRLRRPDRPRDRRRGRSSTWASTAGTPMRDIPVDTVFIGSLHEQPHRGPAGGRRRARRPPRHGQAGDGRARQPRREGPGRGRGPRPGVPSPPAPTGASRAARCAWR